ncbi:diguanylate cyclase/phosphodiesterase with PAS/PAC and GAF sensor(s) [Thermodesulfobium narugense DSM 14796]|uniref:Diguanylate cyclase/phosphodiesterase with PAS/PAC and GAF sensor(S) n=1 Tax=Thermodesulfobium narugense DSM 14796 TaxID=747365 RepID=M1E561_9BACT|nr:EAL domain-containing protein [Thermodesulfobium narugense]AEE14061.1 diguanylate cyclase/phosphodiesterase with PAS/PAC and GAF sensor(s) [Thermodesulfobium narugense DSM 14796]
MFNSQAFQSLINSSVFGVYIYQGLDAKIVFANEKMAQILEYGSKAELIGKSAIEMVASDIEEVKSHIKRRVQGEIFKAEYTEHYLKSKTKALVPVSLFAHTIVYKNEYSGLIMVLDRTKEKSFEKLFLTLSQINQLIIRIEDEEELLEKICEIAIDEVGYLDCAIGYIDENKLFSQLYTKAKTKELEDALKALKIGADPDTPYGVGTVSRAYHTKEVSTIPRISKLESTHYWHDFFDKFNISSACSIPILKKGKVEYILLLHDVIPNTFDKDHLHLLEEIKLDMSFALEKIESEKWHKLILSAINKSFEFICILDENFNIIYANDRALEISGYLREEIIGKNIIHFCYLESKEDIKRVIQEKLSLEGNYSGIINYKLKDNSTKDFLVNIMPYFKKDKITNYIAVGKILEKEDELLKSLERALYFDPITNLPNNNYFIKEVEKFCQKAQNENQIGALILINPIGFKKINEAFGFDTGNKMLSLIASRLKEITEKNDVVARLESEKFGVLFGPLRFKEYALELSKKILEELTKPYNINNIHISLEFNLAIEFISKDANNSSEILKRAHIALSDAKRKGKNQIGFFKKDIEQDTIRKLKLRSELEQAVSNKEFIIYYQPYVDKDKNIVGMEALMRWKKGNKILLPSEFIEELEEGQYIVDAEDLIIDNVLDDISELGLSFPVSVNLSIKSLFRKDLAQRLISKLTQRKAKSKINIDISHNILNIEIIERSFLENFEYVRNLIENLRKFNVFFSIDDFGTGYSSLSYLSKLKVNFVKIDISFVRNLSDKDTKNVTNAIIALSKSLNIKTIAEGVETVEQFETLKSMGCDYYQGFLFYKPMPKSELLKVLNS